MLRHIQVRLGSKVDCNKYFVCCNDADVYDDGDDVYVYGYGYGYGDGYGNGDDAGYDGDDGDDGLVWLQPSWAQLTQHSIILQIIILLVCSFLFLFSCYTSLVFFVDHNFLC